MIDNIEERLEEWLIAPVQRIIFHLETAKDPDFVIGEMQKGEQRGRHCHRPGYAVDAACAVF